MDDTLRQQIVDILDEISVVITIQAGKQSSKTIGTKTASYAILALISKTLNDSLPEYRLDTTAADLRSGTFRRGDDRYTKGWNDCYENTKANLNRLMGGEL